ncbi:cytochrome P450 [Tanacetum coccineum]
MDNIFEGWLQEHRKQRESQEHNEGKDDFMDILLSVLEGASRHEFAGLDKDTVIKATCLGQQYEFLPFGSGRRMCVGASFALTILHFTLASLIQAFELSKPSKDPVDMSKSVGLTNIKDFPLEVILGPRLSVDMYHYANE